MEINSQINKILWPPLKIMSLEKFFALNKKFLENSFKVDKTKELNAVMMSTTCIHNTNYFQLKFPPSSHCFCYFIVVLDDDIMIVATAAA